ncbi:MAG TPA: N-acetylmuramoyl-L-alanine amidase, partial [Chloroflexota bacterium]|nr:N-acetylmuramoyl-L-alanine amidase [Chloroflexota bacterium]
MPLRLLATGFLVTLALPPLAAAAASTSVAGHTIVIDPGHGGIDTGAIANGLYEKDVTLPISLDVGALLTQAGAHVVYTRMGDVTVGPTDSTTAGLAARASIANSSHADIFVSIHANSLNDPGYAGLMTFYGAPGGYIDGVTRTPSVVDQSRLLAHDVQHAVQQRTQEVDRGVQSADFYVLGNTSMPSILVETGFLTNPTEAQRLASPAYQEQIAEGVASGIATFFNAVGSTVKQGIDANAARFVQDVSLPDHATVSPGQTTTKIWKVANTGTTDWDSTYHLVLQSGGTLPGTASVALPSVAPGSTAALSIPITAPDAAGDYSATWRLAAPDGHVFGDPLWAEINVPAASFTPFWVETTQATSLWSDADPHADPLTRLAQWSYLQVTGPAQEGRYAVTEPASQKRGYIDATAVGQSGPPPANYQPPSVAPPFAPFWVETTRKTALYSGQSDPAVTFGLLSQWSTLQVIAPPEGSRLYVRNPTTGGAAYVDAGAVGPSGPPSAQVVSSPSDAAAGVTSPASSDTSVIGPAPSVPSATYVVKPGDTLFAIARRFHVDVADLSHANSLTDPNTVVAGTTLQIPGSVPAFQPFWVEN